MATRKTAKQDQDILTETGVKIGKALAKTAHKAEVIKRKAKQTTKKIIEETVTKAGEKVAGFRRQKREEVPRSAQSGLHPKARESVEAALAAIAEEIRHYLVEHGPVPTVKILNVMKRRGNTTALVHAALGWSARECRIRFSEDGENVSLVSAG